MNAHEAGFLEFVANPQRRRIRTLLELGPKRRRQFTQLLHTRLALDDRYARRLPAGEQIASEVGARLREFGAPAGAYLIAAARTLDGLVMPLEEALETVVGSADPAFISCLPGALGYFKSKYGNDGYLLHRLTSAA